MNILVRCHLSVMDPKAQFLVGELRDFVKSVYRRAVWPGSINIDKFEV